MVGRTDPPANTPPRLVHTGPDEVLQLIAVPGQDRQMLADAKLIIAHAALRET